MMLGLDQILSGKKLIECREHCTKEWYTFELYFVFWNTYISTIVQTSRMEVLAGRIFKQTSFLPRPVGFIDSLTQKNYILR